ncbi:type III-B CRISPR module-associated protein Cmr5 [Thioflexithrix psekupsensis]|uniref:CRISPR type III-B/RAMP module-associated protein Cmr5 n=1 Tax=Thioflexithrix psekupsensis TaxID=1570016 RepID=A0A251X960_9GAMM|nr:type III-B CRISPR module-associated protein Cmr5 [Thioflexithrix psekupsensis]OUD14536.1 type III-B CRISPR module-associated protein Cmr5 [Thioflexithrix psekupsensis]
MTQTLDQQRAKFAYDAVCKVKPESWAGKYKSYAKKVPMLIKTNGLGATLAFMKGKKKGEEAYRHLLETTEGWLKGAEHTKEFFNEPKKGHGNQKSQDLIEKIVDLDSDDYRYVTLEVMAFYGWLKRFVEAEIDKEGDD